MPTYLDFDSSGSKSNTQKFRNDILAKTLSTPNGPRTFAKSTFEYQKLSDFSNIHLGDVVANDGTTRDRELVNAQGKNLGKLDSQNIIENLNDYSVKDAGDIYKNDETSQNEQLKRDATLNIFKPEQYFIPEIIDHLPRRANLNLYPYFERGQDHNIIGIMSTNNYDTESELFKFAAQYIRESSDGPVFSRIHQNLYTATAGQVNLIDALNGNTSVALDILTGKSPLVEPDNKITVASSATGKGIDFLQTVSGVAFPWSEIPGDYLTDPRTNTSNKKVPESELAKTLRDTTKNPSDLFIEYMGSGQKQALFNNLSYSKYAPNYTTTARSQNTSKIFNFVDKTAQGIKNTLGIEAPIGVAYIGDDRSDDVMFATTDFNDRYVRSPYHLTYKFDPIQAELLQKEKNSDEGGQLSGKLTWISSKSKNVLGANNKEYDSSDGSKFLPSLSTKFKFKGILNNTQEILETLPDNGSEMRSHVANVIDQTSRVFKEGQLMLSRGSAIKYIDKFTGEESGVEFCRVWTKDRPYFNNSDLMKRTGLLRKYESSVLSTPYNLNITPISNGKETNIVAGKNGFYAKKYMFSIENLAWKTSNTPGFTYEDLPYCERGPNGGRVMWFPPYDLKVTEQNSAKWEENVFLGRPEPIYTYSNATRSGTINFKVIVDHPSILNLLVREHFKNMSDEEADNYINAFFAGCEDLDFYSLIRTYTNLHKDDLQKITDYLNAGKPMDNTITWTVPYPEVIVPNTPQPQTTTNPPKDDTAPPFDVTLYFNNDIPASVGTGIVGDPYSQLYTAYRNYYDLGNYGSDLEIGLNTLFNATTGWTGNTSIQENDFNNLYNRYTTGKPSASEITKLKDDTFLEIDEAFSYLTINYNDYNQKLEQIKTDLTNKKLKTFVIKLEANCSAVAEQNYNLKLSYRRNHSILNDIINKIKTDNSSAKFNWPDGTEKTISEKDKQKEVSNIPSITFRTLGYEYDGEMKIELIKNNGEVGGISNAEKNVECGSKNFLTSDNLKRTAPLAFYCRNTTVYISTTSVVSAGDLVVTDPTKQGDPINSSNIPDSLLSTRPVEGSRTQKAKPPLDELKMLVMKVLGECYYFKKMEDESPFVFNSLREKFKYFHPAFHSMTPEGLNSRLTFLQQCLRPGDTIPIKGISDTSDMAARNTTFGPPPICVMRVGDFYNSKVVIRDVNIEYEENTWDLNPEGIGIQPMIANVTLQVNFIGGHGMEKPVERLQNALSSNFYANTEVYDYRSTPTEDRTKFTKEELDKFPVAPVPPLRQKTNTDSTNNIKNIRYIGVIENNTELNYRAAVDSVFTNTEDYFKTFSDTLKLISADYGSKISALFLSPTYRDVNIFDIETGGAADSINLLGLYKNNPNLFIMSGYFKNIILAKIKATNISSLMGLSLYDRYEVYLNNAVCNEITKIIDTFTSNTNIQKLESIQKKLITSLDKLNFIVKTGHDGQMVILEIISAFLSGFTRTEFYSKYDNCISYFKSYSDYLISDLDTSFDFSNPTESMSDAQLKEFLQILLSEQVILNVYAKESEVTITKITKIVNKFLIDPTPIVVKLPKPPISKDSNAISFSFTNNGYIFDPVDKENLIKINSNKTDLGTTLNYYRNE